MLSKTIQNLGEKMTKSGRIEGQEKPITKFGFKIYETNPSVSDEVPTRVRRSDQENSTMVSVVSPDTGELVARGTLSIVEEKEVDAEEFVKLYLAGMRKYGELTKPGLMIFEYVYHQLAGKSGMNKDTVALNAYYIQKWKPEITVRSYNRGLHELLSKEFLFRSIARDVFFVNIRYVFNGDRLALIQLYRRKTKKDPKLLQKELPLEDPE
jgi:hypothetical protein